jgi:ankyrin repeat protein
LLQCIPFEIIIALNGRIEAILDTSQLKGLKSSGSAALMFAALHGYVDVAKWLCEKGVDVNSVNAGESGTAIHLATYAGRMEFVKWLVDEMKFEVDAKDKYGKTPVHWAAMMGRLELLKWLVDEKKADCYATDNDEETPVKLASDSERLEVLRWLVEEKHASFDGRHMAVSAIVNGRMDILKWWTEEGMDAYDSAGLPVLHLAAQLGQLEVVKWLVLEQHVNVAERAKVNGWTALHCGCSYLPVTRWLVEDQHLDVNAKGNMGETALQLAAEYGALEVVQWLVQISGDATVTDTSGKTPETAVRE